MREEVLVVGAVLQPETATQTPTSKIARSLPPYEFVRDRPRLTQQVRIAPAKAALRSVMEGEDIGV